MIYTIGKISQYENYIDTDPNAGKGIGGSVWQTFEEAQSFINDKYRVYGVLADWDKDVDKYDHQEWGCLMKVGKLVKL